VIIRAYRLSLRQFANQAFLGEGARAVGGRWNPPGMPAVYTSESLSLAALEFLAHLSGPQDAPELVSFLVELDSKLVEQAALPTEWQKLPLAETQALGAAWIRGGRSPVLRVPSFVVPSESNFLINPSHRKFDRLKIGHARPFILDPRLY
jgi:RES domain-containing protein